MRKSAVHARCQMTQKITSWVLSEGRALVWSEPPTPHGMAMPHRGGKQSSASAPAARTHMQTVERQTAPHERRATRHTRRLLRGRAG
jgi:hypothetical protein